VSNQDTEVDTSGIEQLTEARNAAKTLWDSGVLQAHEKTHLWQIILRIDGIVKSGQEQDDAS